MAMMLLSFARCFLFRWCFHSRDETTGYDGCRQDKVSSRLAMYHFFRIRIDATIEITTITTTTTTTTTTITTTIEQL